MVKQFGTAALTGLLVAVGLFYLMALLVSPKQPSTQTPPLAAPVEFVRARGEIEPSHEPRTLPKKVLLARSSRSPELKFTVPVESAGVGGKTRGHPSVSGLDPAPAELKFEALKFDEPAIRLVWIEPLYPPRALMRKLEGWVLVDFSIGLGGTVHDARVVAAQPPGIFDRAALNAIRKWEYEPAVQEGAAIVSHGHRARIIFKLPD